MRPGGSPSPDATDSIVDRGDHKVLEHFDVRCGLGIDRHRDHLLISGGDHPHCAAAHARLDRLRVQLRLNLVHPVLHLLNLPQPLHRILHSETSFTRVTRPSNLRTTSRTNGSSSGLVAGPLGFVASPSFSRKSTFTSFPNHSRTCGISCRDCSCAF